MSCIGTPTVFAFDVKAPRILCNLNLVMSIPDKYKTLLSHLLIVAEETNL